MSQILSEENFENPVTPAKKSRSPSTQKGTHPTNPIIQISSHIEDGFLKLTPSPSKGLSVEEDSGKRERDRINNLVQKEKSLEASGLTRKKYMEVIGRQLNKKKSIETRDGQGILKIVEVDDDVAQRWAVEKLAVIFGDMIERKEIEHDLGDKTLERFKALSVAELKARAADLLLGKPVSRLPALDVEGGVRE